jgi:uncharacterized damage-inducible protein DinB
MPDAIINPEVETSFHRYFAKIFEHDRWANGLVLQTMAGLGEELPIKPLNRLSHLIACQRLWLSRLTETIQKPESIFPEWSLDETSRNVKTISAQMKTYLEEIPEAALHRHFEFTSLEGQPYRLLKRDILTQLGQHGAYHRGQIAMELNPLLDEPLTTDYVYYMWERLDSQGRAVRPALSP